MMAGESTGWKEGRVAARWKQRMLAKGKASRLRRESA
jgi:hypothetical protein